MQEDGYLNYAMSPDYLGSALSNSAGGVVIGGTIGAGGGISFSNARRASDLTGNAQTYNINVGVVSISASFGEGGIFSVNAGLSAGASLDLSTYQISTTIVRLDVSGC